MPLDPGAGPAVRMRAVAPTDAVLGALLLGATIGVLGDEWGGGLWFARVGEVCAVAAVALMTLSVPWSRRIYALIGVAMVGVAVLTRPDWLAAAEAATASGAFIVAFFTALTSLRNAALTSQAIARCGRFLAEQPPPRRYGTLTLGGQMFGVILGYAAISLLGSLAETGARRETDPARRARRLRRMLLAVQRGFVSTLPWSPLAFATAITISVIPGASWGAIVAPSLVSAGILVVIGWVLDGGARSTAAPAGQAPPPVEEGWWALWPLVTLLAILAVAVALSTLVGDVRTIAVVMLVTPLLSLAWVMAQNRRRRPARVALRRGAEYLTQDLPSFRSELVLLAMAGFIGTLGAALLGPVVDAAGLDLSGAPAWLILSALVWLVPAAGQLGMNPILFVSLAAPLLPPAAEMGVSPSAVVVALTAGWALGGASSPFTATTLLVGAYGGVSATHVGVRWNGLYTLICGVLLSAWVSLYAAL